MKKVLFFSTMLVTAMQIQAQPATQDTYIGAALATEDLNGTARYVGMGGAMDALGAEISTMGSNPAGIGLFRKNQVSASMSVVSQEGGKTFQNGSKTHVSFDQVGVVFSSRTGKTSYLNFGFNFHKNRNFNHVLSAENVALNGSSQNLQTVTKFLPEIVCGYLPKEIEQASTTQLDWLYLDMLYDKDEGNYYSYEGKDYTFTRSNTGYIGEFDFNISGNIKNRLYLGLTVGVHNVNYKNYSEYYETLKNESDLYYDDLIVKNDHKITGTGFNVKAGLIFRPVDESPFRIGLSVSSPTFYKLTTENYTELDNSYEVFSINHKQDFRFNTPWKFGLSLGHTISNYIALGAVYEYADYGACDMRTIDGGYYDWYYYDTYSEKSSTDNVMKRHIEQTLKGVHTFKIGGEFKVDNNIALRLGYNHVTPMYEENGVRDQRLESTGVYYASSTHYVNWKDTNRITAGVGFSFDKFRLDLAYQYSSRKGDFYPFMKDISNRVEVKTYDSDNNIIGTDVVTESNHCDAVSVKDNRHQIQASLTYTF